MVAEVGFASGKETRNGGLQFVVDPKTTHGVVDGGIDHHRSLVRVLVRDLLVHLEEVAIFLFHGILAQPLDGVGEVEVDSITCAYAIAGIATFFCGTACHITRDKVAKRGITALQVVVAVFFRYLGGF